MSTINLLNSVPPTLLTYVAAPYTIRLADGSEDKPAIEARMKMFSECMGKLIERKITAVSPLTMHLVRMHCTELPGDWEYWGNYSEVMLKKCDVLIVLQMEGWENSTGVKGEIDIATKRKTAIIYIDPTELLASHFPEERRQHQDVLHTDTSK